MGNGFGFTGAQHPDVGRSFGPYRVLSFLGEGGMGMVYQAEHVHLGRRVAIKKLKERFVSRPEALKRFFEEARTVNRIKHPHIVEITDFVEEDGEAYYIMELLEGQTAAKALKIEGMLSPRRALHIVFQVAAALDAAHRVGVVHMDIKPSNIFITERDGQHDFVKLLDFGVAQFVDKTDPVKDSEILSQSLGTPVYMSPEQARGEKVDHRSDIYSLGVVLYELLSGKPPFTAESTPEFLFKHMNVRPVTLSRMKGLPQRIPPAISRVVMRCLEKDPEDRFQSADELSHDVQRAARSSGVILRQGSAPTLTTPSMITGRRMIFAAGAVLLAAALAICSWRWAKRRNQDRLAGSAARFNHVRLPRANPTASHVLLNIHSFPQGAEVVQIEPDQKTLGLTPLRLEVPSSDVKWTVLLKLDGYEARTFRLSLKSNQTLSLDLRPLDAATRPDAAAPSRSEETKDQPRIRARQNNARPGSRQDPQKARPRRLVDPFEPS